MKKKGFTLIELLAVIVVLAVIALIVTPIVTGIIKSSKDSANARSVEGHIKNVDYAILSSNFSNGLSNNNAFDGTKTEIDLSFTYPESDNIRCASYIIANGNVTNATGCKVDSWSYSYIYETGKNAYKEGSESGGATGGDIALTGTAIGAKVLASFPELELGTNGCKVSNATKNYTYMGGCYLRGMQSNNYVWYSGFLWRIMGINQDGSVRLITEENVTSIPYNPRYNGDGTVNFDFDFVNSNAGKWLNDYFYPKLKGNDKILNANFCQAGYNANGSSISDCSNGTTFQKNVALITLDEYLLSDSDDYAYTFSSYLFSSRNFWTMTAQGKTTSNSNIWYANYQLVDSNPTYTAYVEEMYGIRPVINIDANTIITSGNGALLWNNDGSPYILNEDKSVEATGLLTDKVTSGEYVTFANKKYRVVSKDSNGVKLLLDGYYQEVAGTNFKTVYGNNNGFSLTAGIGQKLNGDVLNNFILSNAVTGDSDKISSSYEWKYNEYKTNKVFYTVSLNEETPSFKPVAKVGLIRVGEMLSGISQTVGGVIHYWTITPYYNNVLFVTTDGTSNSTSSTDEWQGIGIRPAIVIKPNVNITGGNGTPFNPYQI